eukprot:evm.model.NODE_27782_length_6271_cov_26.747408.1
MRRVAMGAMALASLSAYSSAARVEECLTPSTYSASKDYFPAAAGATVEEARKFTIEYVQGYKVLTNLTGKRQYILYPCGAPEPDVAGLTIPEGFQRRVLSVPAQKVVTAETVSRPCLVRRTSWPLVWVLLSPRGMRRPKNSTP